MAEYDLWLEIGCHKAVHPPAKFVEILFFKRQTCGIDMATKILEQVGTTLDSRIEIEALYASG